MKNYAEPILKIIIGCEENLIPYKARKLFDGYQLRFPWCDGDVICHSGSYGHEYGHVESYCFPWDENDVTALTSDEFMKKLIAYRSEKMGS